MNNEKTTQAAAAEPEQEELFHAVNTWFHILTDMIQGGDMAKLEGSAVKVYLVVKSHTRFAIGQSFPSIETICKLAGLSDKQVRRNLASLEEFGYLTKKKMGRHNVYTLREKVSIYDQAGKPQAVATWDYIPDRVKAALAELKHVTMSGQLMDGKIIHIETLNLNINIMDGDHANLLVVNEAKGNGKSIPAEVKAVLAKYKAGQKK